MADAPSSTLKDILNSSVLVALITVVLGGIGGNYILHGYQERSKEKDQALDDHKELVKRQEEVAISTFQLLGDAQYFAIALNKVAASPRLSALPPGQREMQGKNNVSIWSRSTDFLERWEKEKTSTGMRLSYFSEGDNVRTAWTDVKVAGDVMLMAAVNRVQMRAARPSGSPPQISPQAGVAEKQKFDNAVTDLARVLERAHHAIK
jgi:hypothetical protein